MILWIILLRGSLEVTVLFKSLFVCSGKEGKRDSTGDSAAWGQKAGKIRDMAND